MTSLADHKIKMSYGVGSSIKYCPLVQRLGHLPLEQVIGVRIPGGQPNSSKIHSIFLTCSALDRNFTFRISLGLGFVLGLEIQHDGSAVGFLQGGLIDFVAFVDVDGAPLTFPSRLELNRRAGSLNEAPLAKVILTTFL